MRSPHLCLAKAYWQKHLQPNDFAIDATCGNGHDTLFLSELLASGQIVALDIQEQAVENTKRLLKNRLDRVKVLQHSHNDLEAICGSMQPRLIVYNLGYLPGGDKTITTRTESTLESIQAALRLLAPDGALSITCYPGHEEGAREEQMLMQFVQTLPKNAWLACHHRWLNKPNAPSLLWIVHNVKTA